MGRVFAEISVFLVSLVLIYYFYKFLEFRLKVMIRKDKEDFFIKHGIDFEGKDLK